MTKYEIYVCYVRVNKKQDRWLRCQNKNLCMLCPRK